MAEDPLPELDTSTPALVAAVTNLDSRLHLAIAEAGDAVFEEQQHMVQLQKSQALAEAIRELLKKSTA